MVMAVSSHELRPKRLLLLTPNTMNHLTGGTILFRSFVERLSPDELWWGVAGGSDPTIPSWMDGFKREVFTSLLFSRPLRGLGRKTPAGRVWRRLVYEHMSSAASRRLATFVERERIDAMWVLANGPSIPVAVRLQELSGMPMHVSVQDDIDGQLARPEADALRPSFRRLLIRARSIDVTSDGMLKYYDELYGVGAKSVVVYPNAREAHLAPPGIRDRVRRIGYAGILWASDAFESLLRALDRVNARREHAITLVAYGQLHPQTLAKRRWVDFRGTAPPDKMTGLLQDCDLLYVPMSFDARQEILSRTSMPAKLFSYVRAQVPLLAHGPTFATNVDFVRNKGVGWAISTTDPDEIAETIERADADQTARRAAAERCADLVRGELDSDKNWNRLAAALRGL
jgi:glycosyltransferase involved in cell wall biosynthesis